MSNNKFTPEQETNLKLALSVIAGCLYTNHFTVLALGGQLKMMPQCDPKDKLMFYLENQRMWIDRMQRSLKRHGMDVALREDVSSDKLIDYYSILETASTAVDTSGLSEIVEATKGIKDLTPVLGQIKAILFNRKSMESNG